MRVDLSVPTPLAYFAALVQRDEGLPLLEQKFRRNLARRFDDGRQQRILEVALDQARLEAMPVRDFMDLLAG